MHLQRCKAAHSSCAFERLARRTAAVARLLALDAIAACNGSGSSADACFTNKTSTKANDTRSLSEGGCWTLPVVNRARIFPAPGRAAQLVDGTIMGSATSPTNGFVVLATITSTPAESMFTELTFPNATPYRYVKYNGPRGSYGAIAELEFYAGTEKLGGAGFGVAGSRDDPCNTYERALDGDTSTFLGLACRRQLRGTRSRRRPRSTPTSLQSRWRAVRQPHDGEPLYGDRWRIDTLYG